MAPWSLSLGKVFGVEVRVHPLLLVLPLLSMFWAAYLERTVWRGLMLWLLVVLSLAVRETLRAMAAAWFGLEVKSVLLLPTGGIQSYADSEAVARAGEPAVARWMALIGPAGSFLFALTVGGVVEAVAPEVNLWEMSWVTPLHLLRALVWINLLLSAVNLLPAWPLDAGGVGRSLSAGEAANGRSAGAGGLRAAGRIGPVIAAVVIVFGMVTANWWLIMGGIGVLAGAQIERQGLLLETVGEPVRVSDVMLTDYAVLSASATLEDAVEQARHTLQDVFPVVRGGSMVGAVARQTILEALDLSGNGYVQGIMAKTFETARPGDPLLATLNRVTSAAGVSSQLVPVVEDGEGGGRGGRIVGIMTPQNLQRSMRQGTRRRAGQPGGRSGDARSRAEDESD